MKISYPAKKNEHGFTLLEVIVCLMVAAILGTVMYQYSRTTLSSTVAPIIQLNNIQKLNEVMESITGDYQARLAEVAVSGETDWIEQFGNDMVTNYGSEVDSITSELGIFASNTWTSDSSGQTIKIRIVEDDQALTALFSE